MQLVGFWTDYALNKMNDQVLRGTVWTPPTIYAGLSKKIANRAIAVSELSGGGYARVAVGATNFAVSAAGYTVNASPIVFATPTTDWAQFRSLFLADALTSGNILAIISVTASDPAYLVRLTGQTLTIPAGVIQLNRA